MRTSALVPYAIVTVVSAFFWRFAWTQDGWLAGTRAAHPVLAVDRIIILAEVWKTVPFMALLLMAGLALVPRICSRPPRWTAPPWNGSGWSPCR